MNRIPPSAPVQSAFDSSGTLQPVQLQWPKDGAAIQSGAPIATPRRIADRVEWPTVVLAGGIYFGWISATLGAGLLDLPVWVWAPVVLWCTAWQTSLQHEVIHGHPTPSRLANRLIAGPPLTLWLVFDRYRATHLAHHRDERLTDPIDDPESFYVTREDWRRSGRTRRVLLWVLNTLAGRLTLGPFWVVGRFLSEEFETLITGDRRRRRIWFRHLGQAGLIAAWLTLLCGIPLWVYLAAVVWPATALVMLRSFAEHRTARDPAHRTAIVDDAGPLGWLFLANNLHALHHERPRLPWYALPKVYAANKDRILARNGGYHLAGYLDVVRRWLLVPRDHPWHSGCGR